MSTALIEQKGGAIAQMEQQDSGAAFLTIIAAAARDPNVDIAKMESLLRMQESLAAKQAEILFNQAMTRLQPKLPRIVKRGKIAFTDKKGVEQATPFARYEDIDAAIRPLLCQEGFSISFGTVLMEKPGIVISATLSHAGGHSRTESMPLPFDTSGSKNSIQAVGSTLTYGKRYLICAMLNLIMENEDDDGNAISFINERQVNNIIDLQAELGWDKKPSVQTKFLEFMGVKSISEILRRDYEKALQALKENIQKAKDGGK